MLPYSSKDTHDRDTCACGCGRRVAYNGLEPRFAMTTCRTRWIDRLAIRPCDTDEDEPPLAGLDTKPQDPPPPAAPVPAEDVAEVQAEFAQRVAVAEQVESVLDAPPPWMWVQPRSRSLWKALAGVVRRVR